MAYGDYDGPDKATKGMEGGACNRQRCQAEPAVWYNHGSYSWYCVDCADAIGNDPVNMRDWMARWHPKLGHMMFETREQMDERKAREQTIDGKIEMVTSEYFGWPKRREKPQSASLSRLLRKARTS